MRERHKLRFVEATAELRSRHKAMAKRVRALEVQLSRNSVRLRLNFSTTFMFTYIYVI